MSMEFTAFKNQTKAQRNVRNRTSNLVKDSYRKNLLPTVISGVGAELLIIVDSLFAGRFIGENAIAAIAMTVPFVLFEDVLHNLFVAGTASVVTRYKSIGENEKAARAFGAVFSNQLFWYTGIQLLLILFGNRLMSLFSDDRQLVSDALLYYYPLMVGNVFTESGFCMEQGFRTDGRANFFAFRGVLGIILNLIFNSLAVFVFHGGITGLSIATALAGSMSYLWSGSHFFSRKCTIRPDFSVLKAPAEMKRYLREEYAIGFVYALDDGIYVIVGSVMNQRLLACGGVAAITGYGIVTVVTTFYFNLCSLVEGVYYQLSDMYYSDRDPDAFGVVFRSTMQLEMCFGTVLCLLAFLMPGVLAEIYRVTSPLVKELLPGMLLLHCMSCVLMCIGNITSSFLIIIRQNQTANKMNLLNNMAIMGGVILGSLAGGIKGLFIGHVLAVALVLGYRLLVVRRSGVLLAESKTAELTSCSCTLSESMVSESSRMIFDFFFGHGYGTPLAAMASAVTEECALLMLERNRNTQKTVSVDIRLLYDEDGYCITLIDNGEIFDPYDNLIQSKDPERLEISRSILKGFAPDGKYSRMLDLNISHLYLNKEKNGRSAVTHVSVCSE